ncbi:hypothetical protein B7463_g8813, partial [Scytalidium lignicola]
MDVIILLSQALAVCPGLLLGGQGQKSKLLLKSPVYRVDKKYIMPGMKAPDRRLSTVSGTTDATTSTQETATSRRHRRHRNVKPHGKPFEILILENIKPASDDQLHIENYKFLASYNWKKTEKPTIYVPGAPARWTSPKLPTTASKDTSESASEKGDKMILPPAYAPFFASLQEMQPTYSFLPVSLVTDRNSLRKLLGFASGHARQDWRIYVELVKDTLFLIRWEADKRRIMTGSLNSGYGHSLEKKFAKFDKDLKSSTHHHRIAEYDVGGMKWVVRYEADGYLEEESGSSEDTAEGNPQPEAEVATPDAESPPPAAAEPEPKSVEGVDVIQKGRIVPPESIIEIKTKNGRPKSNSRLDVDKVTQCWFSQTKSVFLVHHQDGAVDSEPVKIDLGFEDWEKKQQARLGKLITIIKEITEIARRVEGGRCCLYCDRKESPSAIRIFKSNEDNLKMSEELKKKYWGE